MTYLVEIPVEAGGRLVVEAYPPDVDELVPAGPGELVARAARSLESRLDDIKPALGVVLDRLRGLAATEVEVEFGLVLGAETGVVVAKGSTEVHLTVKLAWKHSAAGPTGAGAAAPKP